MSKEKRRVGRPRIEDRDKVNHNRVSVVMRKDLITQMDAEMEKHSKVLGFKINRQQFIQILLNSWRDK